MITHARPPTKLLRITGKLPLLLVLMIAFFGPTLSTTAQEELPWLEYSYLNAVDATSFFGYNNPNDIVTPVIEEKFKIRVNEVVSSAGQTSTSRINMMVAAGNLPDVVMVSNTDLPLLWATGAFADLTPYKDQLTNMDQFVSDRAWSRLTVDGKLVALPTEAVPDETTPEFVAMTQEDPFYRPPNNWAFMVREDILRQLGYEFVSVADLQSDLDENPRRLTEEDLQLNPPIETLEDFEKLLYDIKALDLKVDGRSVIPLSIPDWGAYHLSPLFAPNGGYAVNPSTMEVTGYVNNPYMKDFYSHLTTWFQDGILDNDYLIHKAEQLQEKISSGRVAVMFFVPEVSAARSNLQELNPEWGLRPIPWPKSLYEQETGYRSYVDASFPTGFGNLMIRKDFPDIPRLLQYFDWMQTEEAKDLSVWGPESAGLWEIRDGVKVFKDDALWDAIRTGTRLEDGRNAEYYGLYDRSNPVSIYTSKAFLTAPPPFYNNLTYERSYPPRFDAWSDLWNLASSVMLSTDGTVLPPSGEASNLTSDYYWGTFRTTKVAELLSITDPAAFDAKWNELVAEFNAESGYDAAIEEMKPLFERSLAEFNQ